MVTAKRDPRVHVSPHYAAQRRTSRRPQHRFNLRLTPYEIQPFMLAPVLPGETFQNCMLQAQAWSDPLRTELRNVGWWLQWNFFYIRHRDLPSDVRNVLAAMLLDSSTDMSSLVNAAGDEATYTFPGAVDWATLCLQHVVSEFFRDEGEAWDDHVGPNGLPLAQIYGRGQSDGVEKLTFDDDYEDRRVDLIESGNLYANELNTMMGHWAAMRDAGLTEMDYQDFMKTYGSTVREDEESPNLHRAEDIWSMREFTYPTNTVEPTTGVPAVAAGWRVSKSGGRRIYCDEPGFVFGVVNARPKVYLKNILGSLAGSMSDVRSWLPAMLHDQVDLGHRKFDWDAGPLAGVFTDGESEHDDYWIDLRDLFLYGDQFINWSPGGGDMPFLDLPRADGTRRYIAEGEATAFFAGSGSKFDVDGICSLSVLGRQKATTSGLVLGQA